MVMSIRDFSQMAKEMQIDGDVRKWFQAGDTTGDKVLSEEEFKQLYAAYKE